MFKTRKFLFTDHTTVLLFKTMFDFFMSEYYVARNHAGIIDMHELHVENDVSYNYNVHFFIKF